MNYRKVLFLILLLSLACTAISIGLAKSGLLKFVIRNPDLQQNYEQGIDQDIGKDYERKAYQVVYKDSFPVFDNPEMAEADVADVEANEPVIGIEINGEAIAFPVAIMGVHELGNVVCGKTPIAVSW